MPTAARFVGAVMFAALGWYVSGLIVPLFPEGTDMGWFTEVNAALGLFVGWKVAGPRGGTGYGAALSYGLTTAFALFALGLFLHSSYTMIEKSLRKLYDGPMEAVVSVFELMIEHAVLVATPQVIGTFVIGGLVGGLVTEFFGRRFT